MLVKGVRGVWARVGGLDGVMGGLRGGRMVSLCCLLISLFPWSRERDGCEQW